VLLALIDKGMNRQEAYKIVQSNAMRAWEARTPYLDLLSEDPAVTERLPRAELERLFDYDFYVQHVDASFRRLGL
jgi:adenylosuccinate lyase